MIPRAIVSRSCRRNVVSHPPRNAFTRRSQNCRIFKAIATVAGRTILGHWLASWPSKGQRSCPLLGPHARDGFVRLSDHVFPLDRASVVVYLDGSALLVSKVPKHHSHHTRSSGGMLVQYDAGCRMGSCVVQRERHGP